MRTTLDAQAILALRRDFDSTFQRPEEEASRSTADFLLLKVGGTRYAVSLRSVALLQSRYHLTQLPSKDERLLGLSSARGELLAVYDLSLCLGHGKAANATWSVRVSGTALAFAFAELERHARFALETGASEGAPLMVESNVSIPLLDLQKLAERVSTEARKLTTVWSGAR